MELGEKKNVLADEFPKKEIYNPSSQLRRTADSIALNISEGSIVQSKPEFRKFMGCAIQPLAEVITCLYKAKNKNYIKNEDFQEPFNYCYKLMNRMIAFRNKI